MFYETGLTEDLDISCTVSTGFASGNDHFPYCSMIITKCGPKIK